jgi:hypothetical protein
MMGAVHVHAEDDVLEREAGPLSDDDLHRVADDTTILRDAYGSRWNRVPTGFGEEAERARAALSSGLVAIELDRAEPMRVAQEIGAFLRTTSQMTSLVLADALVLGDAFGAELSTLPLRRLRRLCRAIIRLSEAPPLPPTWASPSSTQAAGVVLSTLGEHLRALADIRRSMYEEFTEDVWSITGRGIRARRELAPLTRTGKPPSHPKRSLLMLRQGRELEGVIDDAWEAVSGHLGHFAVRGIPDVDGANEALAAMRDLQMALGDELRVDKVRALAAADAFICDELMQPARAIAAAIDAWELKANTFGGVDPTGGSVEDIWLWAISVSRALDLLGALRDATAPLRSGARTAGDILDDAIRRDRVHHASQTIPTAVEHA